MVFGRLKKKQPTVPAEDTTAADAPVEAPEAGSPRDAATSSEPAAPAEAGASGDAATPAVGAESDQASAASPAVDAPTVGAESAETGASGDNATPAVASEPATGVVVPRDNGPFDISEKAAEAGYIDLGALRIGAAEGLQLRLEVEEKTKRVIAVTLDLNGSNLQLQAFAAPRTDGLWDEIRSQIGTSVGSQGGTVQDRVGAFGTELVAKLPAQTAEGQPGYRVARFVGVDGPRWFLRGVIGGPAAINREAAAPIEELFRNVVVVRGDHPLPPRELLQLRLPKETATAPPAEPAQQTPDLTDPLKRGPEITHIG